MTLLNWSHGGGDTWGTAVFLPQLPGWIGRGLDAFSVGVAGIFHVIPAVHCVLTLQEIPVGAAIEGMALGCTLDQAVNAVILAPLLDGLEASLDPRPGSKEAVLWTWSV